MTKYTFKFPMYQYKYVPATEQKAGKLMIRMKADMMQKFRTSEVGRRVGRFVDIFAQGGGWYEITTNDDAVAVVASLVGAQTDGLASWLREFNLAHLGKVNANPAQHSVEYCKRIVPANTPVFKPAALNQLAALQNKFSKAA